jgi:group I intron endonuclease
MLVYLVTNKINGKMYVGQTSQSLRKRWNRHKSPMNHRRSSYLFNAICKYGAGNFEVEPLVIVGTKQEMDFYETELIKFLDLRDPSKGYNLTEGGGGMLGFKLSDETRKKMSAHVKSPQHCKKISEAKMGNKSRTGMKASAEEIRKRSEALKGRKLSEEHVQSLRIGSHNRYHVKKGVINPECKLCQQGIQCQSTIASEPPVTLKM